MLGILPRARAQIKNQEPEFSLKLRTRAKAMNIWEVGPAQDPFVDTKGFAKLIEN